MTDYPRPTSMDDFVTLAELAEAFGVSPRSIASWRGLPRVRIGAVTFFRKVDVATWLDRRIEGTGRRVTT